MLQGYASNGAGSVMSKEALRRFGNEQKKLCNDSKLLSKSDDVIFGACMQRLGVRLADSRDALGRSRFHCFSPNRHINGSYPNWFSQYDKYGAQTVMEFC
jgi:glycoprotein-N-acetylgalactosamine 3-beta-galactosyltransferase